jgi:hypothetical protein
MSDPVRDFLRRQQCADFIIVGGLSLLVTDWEAVVGSVARGEEQYEDDYLNDVDGRRILDDALKVAPPAERARWEPRVAAADAQIRPHLLATRECLWGEENAGKYGYTRERDWWYYHRPRIVDPSWRTF